MTVKQFRAVMGGLLLCASAWIQALELQGQFIQGGLLQGQVEPGTVVTVGERRLRTSEDGRFVVGLDRDAAAELVVVTGAGEAAVEHRYAVVARDYNLQHIEGIAQKIMEPDPAAVARSRDESRQVRAARSADRVEMEYAEGFRWPLEGPITGVFGSQRVYNGVPKRPHYGVDVAAPTGTLVKAPAAGLVTLAHPDMFYSGGTLIIDHGHSLSSSFLHLSEILVKVGDYVQAGDDVAKVGATGRATGPHLDWRMNWYGNKIDPQLLVPAMPSPDVAAK
jgi:murein DD-endopeptidase MepM/ murein hydrolase activator NlpD